MAQPAQEARKRRGFSGKGHLSRFRLKWTKVVFLLPFLAIDFRCEASTSSQLNDIKAVR
jgi:hypothetical protein